MPIFFCLVLIILVGDYLVINAGSLQIKLGWSWATITSTLHIEVSSLGCKLSIFFFFSKKKESILIVLFMVQPGIKRDEIDKP